MLEILAALIVLAPLVVLIVLLTIVVIKLVRAWARHRVAQTGSPGIARVESCDLRSYSFVRYRPVYRLSLSVVPENGAPPFAAGALWAAPQPRGLLDTRPLLVHRFHETDHLHGIHVIHDGLYPDF